MTFNRSPLEKNLQNKVIEHIKTTYKKEAWFLNTVGSASQRSGIPDILACVNGKFIGIELKREDGSGRPSPQQEIEVKKINQAGGYAIISSDYNEIKNFIYSIYKKGNE